MLNHKIFTFSMALALFLMQPLSAFACATCGCSELCPLAMMSNEEQSDKTNASTNSLSDSLWGNIILKMAYQRDLQLQKLRKHGGEVNTLGNASIMSAVGGTVAQNIVSSVTLNYPGNDSYLPPGLGLGMSGLVNITLDGMIFYNWHLKKKVKARQLIVRQNVEKILEHLEYSETDCPEAQTELAAIIGDRAAGDCIKLWRSSHASAYASKTKTISAVPVLKSTL